MAAMTVVARRGDGEAFREEPFTMDALAVVLENVRFGQIVGLRDRGALAVAAATRAGNVHLEDSGLRVLGRKDVVQPVAVRTGGGEGSVPGQHLSMDAAFEVRLFVFVTIATLDAREIFRVVLARVLVAVGAVEFAVDRAREGFWIHIEGDGHATTLDLEFLVVVAGEAGVVVGEGGAGAEEDYQENGENLQVCARRRARSSIGHVPNSVSGGGALGSRPRAVAGHAKWGGVKGL